MIKSFCDSRSHVQKDELIDQHNHPLYQLMTMISRRIERAYYFLIFNACMKSLYSSYLKLVQYNLQCRLSIQVGSC